MAPDTFIFHTLQSFTGNPALDQIMFFFAEFLILAVPAGLVYLWYQGEDGRMDSLYVFTAVLTALIASYTVLGQAIQHQSPFQIFDTIASGSPENSFPSQHTATILATVLPLFWRKRQKLAYLSLGLGILTGLSRIYIGEHYLIDIAGSTIAALIGFSTVYIVDRYFEEHMKNLAEFGNDIERKIFGPFRKLLK